MTCNRDALLRQFPELGADAYLLSCVEEIVEMRGLRPVWVSWRVWGSLPDSSETAYYAVFVDSNGSFYEAEWAYESDAGCDLDLLPVSYVDLVARCDEELETVGVYDRRDFVVAVTGALGSSGNQGSVAAAEARATWRIQELLKGTPNKEAS